MHGKRIAFLAALAGGIVAAGGGEALEASGTVVRADRSASADGSSGWRSLETDGPVYMRDEITTDRNGQAQIRLRDDTRLVVGPSSRVLIDSFVFNNARTARQVGIELTKGAFRFISGRSAKQAYSIRTPTMAIGIRGTAFDVAVRPGGETAVAWHQGSGQLCDAGGQCIAISAGCRVVVAPPGGGFAEETGLGKARRLGQFFPFVRSQGRLLAEFRLAISACGPVGGSAVPSGAGDRDGSRGTPGGGPGGSDEDPPEGDTGDGDSGEGGSGNGDTGGGGT